MNTDFPNALGSAVRGFFSDYLPTLRGLSRHTLLSYRDTLTLLLRFLATSRHVDPVRVREQHHAVPLPQLFEKRQRDQCFYIEDRAPHPPELPVSREWKKLQPRNRPGQGAHRCGRDSSRRI